MSSSPAYSGTSGGATITLTPSLSYTNPDTAGSESFSGSLSANEFIIFVGARSLGGLTLGQGGPGGVGLGVGSSLTGSPSEAQVQAAADSASASASAAMTRGGHVIETITGAFGDPYAGVTYSTSFGPTIGNLWFDNDGSTTWHLDHTTSVALSSSDLYSVALHEMLHSLGIGISNPWDDLVSGTDWLGSEAIAEYGSGTALIDSGGGHIASSIMSTRLSDGGSQEVVMDPDITTGTRKELTDLDLAFLRDIGWQTVPEPTSSLLLCLGALLGLTTRRRL
ncbi:MAG: PEP-CTERM sorting domain-containing protein [Verrucomicrobiae bacterium]|nr:PEP-CTERM sorting domain-containing protein [Verrucomicrobiae bacterium]